ncbi:hypothetical protein [Devosia sp. FJ2-5-3]|uniref:hypothetical protein n=1 Tax=Devosia sp. FJ2-5-3 TaxID=2976680 RepID=UPI0023D7EA8B|nr:hypothetical protein [Devosia sp. FJ2-5-3]WEJ56716.1 hypothetical protein N0P34_10805 [Devosia sp. FJ2-5-3]
MPPANAMDLPFQRYMLGRFGKRDEAPCPLLDEIPVETIAGFVEALGLLFEHGALPTMPGTTSLQEKATLRELGYSKLVGGAGSCDFTDIVSGYRVATGIICPKEPIAALGFIKDAPALFSRGRKELLAFLCDRLGLALGYPVHDLWRSEYIDIDQCAAEVRMPVRDVIKEIRANGWSGLCYPWADRLFVPVDVHWQLQQIAK